MRTNFNMDEQNLTMVKGDTLAFNIVFADDEDLESADFSCKKVPNSSESGNTIFHKSLGDGITKVDSKTYAVLVDPADTDDAQAGAYYYDLQIKSNGCVYTVLLGLLTLLQDVTN